MPDDYDIDDDGQFRCPMCEIRHYWDNGKSCADCDERFCPECFAEHLNSDEHRRNTG